MKNIATFFALLICSFANGQSITKRALFIGNSYTQVNNLPQMIADVTASTGDSLIFDSNTPGGYTFEGHSTNATSLAKIVSGNWDYVVLQEQSQRPSFPIGQVEAEVFAYAEVLDSIINATNLCGETVFYMTWGRKDGDASNCGSWPPVCTYSGMDSILNLRYRMMADSNNAIISPVSAVWKYIRQNFPLIELYQADGSHPSVAGTYAAACCFYATLFRKDPSLITFNTTLSATDAEKIRAATKLIVYDNMISWYIGEYDPKANFTYDTSGVNEISFTNSSANATTYYWDFGDGNTSTSNNPTHAYSTTGSYVVSLIANKCDSYDTTTQTINITPVITSAGINEVNRVNSLTIYPNPTTTTINVQQNFSNNTTYKILHITGQEMQSGLMNNVEKQINVSSLEEGIYFLKVFDNNKSIGLQKFVKSACP